MAVTVVVAFGACRSHDDARSAPLDGRLADAGLLDAAPTPADAAGPPAATPTKLVAAGDSTCAVMSNLTVQCWGGNAHGQLGTGTTADAAHPVTLALRHVKDVQLADGTACALLDDASVACWGRVAWHGHAEDVLVPTGVLGVIGVKQLFVVPGRACARVANDTLVCWGNVDARGHFAPGPTNRAPTPVVGLDHVAGLVADGAFSDDGRLWSWGHDGVPRLAAVAGVQELADRDGTVCGRLAGGRIACAASDRCGPHKPGTAASGGAVAPGTVAAAGASPGAGAVAGAGAKPGISTRSGKPAKPGAKSTKSASKPAGGKSTKLAATAKPPPGAGGSAEPTGEPVDALGFTDARQLAFELGYCVVTASNKLQCGDGCRAVDPPKLDRVAAVVGRCAQLRSGGVACFDAGKPAATPVPGITRASQLAVGRAHACAVVENAIVCWGNNAHGQLGGFALSK